MTKWLILSALLTGAALGLSQSERHTPTPLQERVSVCPRVSPWGVRVTLPSGRVLYYCPDGVYTPEQMLSGRLWDDGE